jgi:zinc protease
MTRDTRPIRTLAAWLVLALVATATLIAEAQNRRAAASFRPQDLLPLDAAIRTGTLPNGLKYYIRQNARPANRISLRLAVKAGSLMEADDQQGLAHLIEHMAFNGSVHFKSGEIFSYFESVGARLGPHVNAYTSFDETVYMLDLPTDKPEVLDKGFLALSDYAGGLTFPPDEVEKERPVVIEEWRLGLGASSRIRDKQLPLLFYKSRYAQRLPIGKPDIVRTAPVARLRAFYDAWYRPERMAFVAVGDLAPDRIEASIKKTFAPLAARAPAAPLPDRKVPLHKEVLVNVSTDPELTRSSVTIERKRAREGDQHVADYRRDLVQRLVEHIMTERLGDLARRPDAKFLGAGVGGDTLGHDLATFSMGAGVPDGKLEDGITALAVEANRVREFGFSASEVERARSWMTSFYERAYNERDKSESGSYASEYLRHFLNDEPSPGIEYEYRLVQQVLPTITAGELAAMARTLLADDSRVILAVSPQKAGIRIPTEAELQSALTAASAIRVTPWTDTVSTRGLMERAPAGGGVESRRTLDELGVTVVRFSNGVDAWLKPTDFKNDQVLWALSAMGGLSLAPPGDYVEASLSDDYVGLAGAGGLKAGDLQKLLVGKRVGARPFVSLSTHGISGSAAPGQLETALQLMFQEFSAPGDDADAFALLKRQLDAMVANRGRSPGQIFAEKLAQVNSSNHYTSQPLTPERVAGLNKDKVTGFYRQIFANAADFTFFMVGAFKVDEVLPLLTQYVGSLPSTGHRMSQFKDVGIRFPEAAERANVEAGREPRGQAVISFFADPSPDPAEQEQIQEAATVLETVLRDVLREDLGQTYSVSVGLLQRLPQRGDGHIQVRFGAAPENLASMTARVMQEVAKLQQEGPSADLTSRAREAARRSYETSLRQNEYWLGRLQVSSMFGRDPQEILTRTQRIDAVTPERLQEVFKRYFPADRATIVTLKPMAAASP